MKRIVLMCLVVCLSLWGCDKQQNTTPQAATELSVPLGKPTALNSTNLAGVSLNVEKVEDSRCPINALCVWAGVAKVTLAVKQGMESRLLVLGIPNCSSCTPELSATQQVVIGSNRYRITLKEVSPYPTGSVVQQADYTLKFTVEEY
jgi:hypothetical protein